MDFFGLEFIQIVERLVLGLVIGCCIGLTGVGGGVLVLPALTVFLKMNAIAAVGTASLYAFLTKIFATIQHAKLNTVQWKLCTMFLAGAVPVNVFVSRWVAGHGNDEDFALSLQRFVAGVVLFCVAITFSTLMRQLWNRNPKHHPVLLSDRVARHKNVRRSLAVGTGAIVGALIGATSIGGGVLIVPILMLFFGLTARQTVGSSIFISVVLTFVTSISYFTAGSLMEPVTAFIMAAGAIIGVPVGSRLSVKMPDKVLQSLVILLISIAAAMLLVSSMGH